MTGPLIDKSFAGMMRARERDITELQRRLARAGALPDRLGPTGAEVTDWNLAVQPGFYWSNPGALNAPSGDGFVGEVFVVGGGTFAGRIVQELRSPTDGATGRITVRRIYNGTTWGPWRLVGGVGEGPSTWRLATTPRYFDMWYDTTDGLVYVGNKTGTWRRFSGTDAVAAGAWALSTTSGTVINVGRTVTFTIPTVLEATESLIVSEVATGSGYGFSAVTSIVKNPTNTVLTMRHMQIGATTTQPLYINWQVTQA